MFSPLIQRGDFTLADGGNGNVRIDGSSLDGLMAGGVSRKWQKPGPELTVVKPVRLFPKVELHLSGFGPIVLLLAAVNGGVSAAEKSDD